MNWKRVRCALRGYHVIVEEEYLIESPFSSTYVYHAEVRERHRCVECGWTRDVVTR